MADILLFIFKNRPDVVSIYYKYRHIIVNFLLLCSIAVAILAASEKMRSLSLGFAAGIVMINIGESISRLRIREDKKLRAGNSQVNG